MIPDQHLEKTAVFHITHMDNLASMLSLGQLLAKNVMVSGACESIANEEVQNRRSKVVIPIAPGGLLHDYVPFYFAPRSPMLYCNHRGSIPNAKPQSEVIHLMTTAQIIDATGRPTVFYDRHAVVGYAQAFNKLEDMAKIDWRIFFEPPLIGGYAQYWQNRNDQNRPHWVTRKEVRQAEFLVQERLSFSCIRLIGTYNRASKLRVEELLKLHSITSCSVETRSDWYF
jgi:hypothetical protein